MPILIEDAIAVLHDNCPDYKVHILMSITAKHAAAVFSSADEFADSMKRLYLMHTTPGLKKTEGHLPGRILRIT